MNIRAAVNAPMIFVTLALIVILPLLAFMQYTWLGQVSEQEYRRMQDNVRTAAFHCSMEFSEEMTLLIQALGGFVSGSAEDVPMTLRPRILKWKSSTIHSAIVSSEITIAPLPPPDHAVQITIDDTLAVVLLNDFSAIAIPIKNNPQQAAFIPLDIHAIQSSLIPEIIEANLSPTVRSEYDIQVLNQHAAVVFHSNNTSKSTVLESPDVAIPLLIFPPTPLSRVPFTRSNRDKFFPERNDHLGPFDRTSLEFQRRGEFSPPRIDLPPGAKTTKLAGATLFELRLKHRDGSLEAAVNNNRLRNLAISIGILLLLGTSMIFLLLSANRAQRLAGQQLEFVASVSHELRTPLAVLKSAGENLADGVIQDHERSRQYGELIKKEVSRLSEMVNKALAYAGIQSGKQIYDLLPLDITGVVEEALRNTKTIVFDDFTIDLQVGNNLPRVLGNATALRSALENLLINAIKYSGEKKWVGMEVHSIEHTKQSAVEIIVRDNGIGIAPSDIAHIFTPFYRGYNAVDRQIEGSGLGLSITKHIVEGHGGTISVRSSLDNGTKITIRLPVAAREGEGK